MDFTRFIWNYLLLVAVCVAGNAIPYKYTCRKDVDSSDSSSMEEFDFDLSFFTRIDIQCCPGYEGPIYNCQPVCEPFCDMNSYCKAGICHCLEGYEKNEEGVCMAACSKDCGENAYCKFPDSCECLDGYEKDAQGQCKLLKDLHLCIKEVEVQCTDFNKFAMNWLDVNDPDLLFLPVPKTRMEKRKVCCEGYERDDEYSPCTLKDPHLCEQEVEVPMEAAELADWMRIKAEFDQVLIEFPSEIISGTRTKVQKLCCKGYERQTDDELCQPICEPKCGANSYCAEPEICKCLDNYHVGINGCVKNLKADEPHVCSKKEKLNFAEADTNMLKDDLEFECCDGYEQNSTSIGCVPKCSKGCGPDCHCVQPEVCECTKESAICSYQFNCPCDVGYVAGKYGLCEPKCTIECPAHSSCVHPEQCDCNEGYRANSNNSCQPICQGTIPEHSSCVRPGEWECDLGYIKLPNADKLSYSCQPHCQQSCSTYGKCVEPDVCECLPGYQTLFIAFEENEFVESCQPIRFAVDGSASEIQFREHLGSLVTESSENPSTSSSAVFKDTSTTEKQSSEYTKSTIKEHSEDTITAATENLGGILAYTEPFNDTKVQFRSL